MKRSATTKDWLPLAARIVLAVTALLSLARNAAGAVVVEVVRNVDYGTGGGHPLLLDIMRPEPVPANPTPAVIFIHGGGWRNGDKRGAPVRFLAENGYFTASIDYRLSDEAPFPAAVEDCKCAVRWLRANAARYGVNSNAIGVWGASAGGHLAEFLGATADDPRYEGRGGWSNMSSRVNAVVSFFGPSDFMTGFGKFRNEDGSRANFLVATFLGGLPADKPGVYREASPITHVSQTSTPMLLVHGNQDPIVPLEQSTRMAEALRQAGAEVQLIVVTNGVHGFFLNEILPISPSPAAIERDVLDWFDQHLRK
jgi:acetyl esterase/lipase